jgi:hypothetical protein
MEGEEEEEEEGESKGTMPRLERSRSKGRAGEIGG